MQYLSELQQLVQRVNPTCSPTRVTADTPLLDERVLDSLQIVSMIAEMETTFGVRVSLEEVIPENFESLRKISDLIQRTMASNRSDNSAP
ncbi:MAG: acyl carrier protein [Planctomycetota bacterium]